MLRYTRLGQNSVKAKHRTLGRFISTSKPHIAFSVSLGWDTTGNGTLGQGTHKLALTKTNQACSKCHFAVTNC